MIKSIHILSIVMATSACQTVQSTRSVDKELYTEDLSTVRPEYVMPEDTIRNENTTSSTTAPLVIPSNDVTYQVNNVLDETDSFRKNVNAIDGFTIQVYSGTDSENARKIRGKLISMLPDEKPELFYDEPNFKVKVGSFFTRIEAQKSFSIVREEFPAAIIIPERIPINQNESDK